jgi:hypothetical protein
LVYRQRQSRLDTWQELGSANNLLLPVLWQRPQFQHPFLRRSKNHYSAFGGHTADESWSRRTRLALLLHLLGALQTAPILLEPTLSLSWLTLLLEYIPAVACARVVPWLPERAVTSRPSRPAKRVREEHAERTWPPTMARPFCWPPPRQDWKWLVGDHPWTLGVDASSVAEWFCYWQWHLHLVK